MQDRSREGLIEFLDWTGTKGLMPLASVQARRATAGKVLSVLNDNEAQDVSHLDVDEVMSRFENLHGKNYSPGSLKTYHSRIKSTLEDFRAYLESPMNFKTSSSKRGSRNTGPKEAKKPTVANEPTETQSSQPFKSSPAPASAGVIPIPIRADLTVHVQGIPFDMSIAEARKIANVILALAPGDE